MLNSISTDVGQVQVPGRPIPLPGHGPRLAAHTDWPDLDGQRVVCVIDDANIRLSTNAAGGRFSYRGLREELKGRTLGLEAWAQVLRATGLANTGVHQCLPQ